MDWQTDFDWNKARTFLMVAEEGSFSGAAKRLRVAQPTVGRQIAALEDELGVALFERAGRGVQLTPTGLELIEHVRIMDAAALQLSRVAAGQSLSLDGPIGITAGEAISAYVLPPILEQVREQHPGILVELNATNAPQDLLGRDADIALRNFCPEEAELIARKVGVGKARLYATPTYLERHGSPSTAEELSRCNFIGFDRTDTFMKGLNQMGLSLTTERFPIVTANQLVQWELVKQGLGVGIMMEGIGDHEPSVQRALEGFPAFPVPMWLICHRELRTSRRVRVVFDLLAKALAEIYSE